MAFYSFLKKMEKDKMKHSDHADQDGVGPFSYRGDIKKYFKKLRLHLSIGLMLAFILPHAIFATLLHFEFNSTLDSVGKLNMEALSRSQSNTIDLFLQERVVNIFSLFHGGDFSVEPDSEKMEFYLRKLVRTSNAFIDVGFLTDQGIQIGYAGPFPYLHGKNYTREKWFMELKKTGRDYYISDIYLGFRNKPHFTIAVKQIIGTTHYIMRSTLDPDKFYTFLKNIGQDKGVDYSMINRDGRFQLVDPERGNLLDLSPYIPPLNQMSGTTAITAKKETLLISHSWLREAQWALLVRQPLSIAHAKMNSAQRTMTFTLIGIILIIGMAISISVNRLIRKAQINAEKGEDMRHQLLHASKLASLGQLATGIAHEINNPLAVITATSGYIKDMLDPEMHLDSSPEKIGPELDTIENAAFRAKKITTQLLDFGRKNKPHLVVCDVNEIIEDVLSGVKRQEFAIKNIKIERNLSPDLPKIPLDFDQIRQVFLNLINNAGDTISEQGTICISTMVKKNNILATIKDDGEGMTFEQTEKIFDPFYTTKEVGKGTGLGLSVSLGIVKSMGGTISTQSLKGSGSSFTVSLPHKKIKGATHDRE